MTNIILLLGLIALMLLVYMLYVGMMISDISKELERIEKILWQMQEEKEHGN